MKKILIIGALLCSVAAHAAEVSVSKLRVNLENGQAADFLNLTNQSAKNKEAFEISIHRWTQTNNNGQDKSPTEVLENTDDIIVSPKTLVVLPNQEKVVRLIVNNNDVATKNYSYRMIITQLPNKELANQTNTVNLLFKISLPIFVYKDSIKTVDKLKLDYNVTSENGKQYLNIKNNDSQHVQLSSINWGEEKQPASFYLLPGISHRTEIPVNYKSDTKKPIEIVTDKGNLQIK